MADIQSNIDINIDTTNALANIKNLQRQISLFHQGLRASGSAANAAISENMSRNLVNSINATKKFGASFTTVQSATQAFTTSLEKNKFSMGQYFRYAAGSTKTFGKLFTTEFNTIEHVAKSRVKTLQTQFIKLGRDAGGAVKAIRVRPLTLDMKDLATQTAVNAQKQQIFNQLIKQGSTNLLNFGKNTQWAGRQLMVGFTIPLAYLGTTAARVFMDMEKQVIKLRRVYGDFNTTVGETEEMVKQIRQLGNEFTKYGVAVEKTMGLAADAAAMGKQGADLLAQVSEANRLAILGGVEQSQALETTISVTNAFGVASEDLASKIDFLNAVENQSVTSIEDLTIAIPKAGPVIQQLGGNVEDLAFFLTAMKEGGINASEGANALKSGLASLINPSEKASEFMQGFGISIKGIVDANKGDVKGIIMGMANALNTLDPLNRARAIEQMFGKFQFARISTLFQNVTKEGSQASTVLGLARATAQELAILSERELKKVEDSPMFKFQKAIEDIKTSLMPLGEQFLKLVTPIIEFGTKALEQFNKLDSGVKGFIMNAVGLLGGIAPVAIMAFGLIANGIANLIKTGNLLRNLFLRAGEGSTILGQQTQYMTNEQLEAAAAAASLDQAHQKLTQQFTVEATAVRKLAEAYNAAAIAGSRLTASGAIGRSRPGGTKAKGYNSGVLSVPGPKGAGDVVPAMLAPGEAVIPADKAQKYRGFISEMIQGKVPGFEDGRTGAKSSSSAFQEISIPPNTFKVKTTDAEARVIRLQIGLLEKEYGASGKDIASKVFKNFEGQKIDSSNFRKFAATYGEILYAKPANNTGRLLGENKKQQERLRGYVPAQDEPNYMEKLKEQAKTDPTLSKDLKTFKSLNQAFFDEVLKDPQTEKEYKAFLKSKDPDYVKRLDGWRREGLNDQQIRDRFFMRKAISVTNFDPLNPYKDHGLGRAHYGGLPQFIKRFKEGWGPEFTQPEPRVINGFISSLTKDGVDTAPMKALEKAAKTANIDGKDDLFKALRSDGSLTPKQLVSLGKLARIAVEEKLIDSRNMRLVSAGLSKVDVSQLTDRSALMPKDENAKRQLISRVLFKGRVPFKYNRGVVSVPGPKGAGDVVPAMLSPGESVIPAAMSKKYAPLIAGMVTDTLPGYNKGGFVGLSGGMGALASFGSKANLALVGAQMAMGFVQKLINSNLAAKIQSKILGGTIISGSGSRFSDGVEERIDKNGNPYYVQPGSGRISKEQATQNQIDPREQRKQERQEKKQARSARNQKFATGAGTVGMIASTVGMGMMMSGNPGMQAAGGGVMAAGMLAPFLPMLMNPIGAVVLALAAVGGSLFLLKGHLDSVGEAARKSAETMGVGYEAMNKYAKLAGKVSSTELMDRVRADSMSPFSIKTGKNTFGASALQSELGKGLLSESKKALLGGEDLSSMLFNQLSAAVASNSLDTAQARSVAYAISEELGDQSVGMDVNAKLTAMFGPNGENLLKDPLKIQIQQIEQTGAGLDSDFAVLQDSFDITFNEFSQNVETFQQDAAKTLGGWADFGKGLDKLISGVPGLIISGLSGGKIVGVMDLATSLIGGMVKGAEGETEAMNAYVVNVKNAIQNYQSSIDSLDAYYQKQIDIATAAGDAAKASQLQTKYDQQRLVLMQRYGSAMTEIVDAFNNLTTDQQNKLVTASTDRLREKFKEDQDSLDLYDQAATKIKGLDAQSQYQLNMMLNADAIALSTFTWISNNLDQAEVTKVLNLRTVLSGKDLGTFTSLLSRFSEAGQANFIATFSAKDMDSGKAKELLGVFTEINRLSNVLGEEQGKELNDFYADPKNINSLKTLVNVIKELKKFDGKSLTIEYIQKIEGGKDFAKIIKADEEYFSKLDKNQQITYTQVIATIATGNPLDLQEDALAYAKSQGVTDGLSESAIKSQMAKYIKDFLIAQARSVTEINKIMKDLGLGGDTTGDDKPSGTPQNDPLEDLLRKLKQVREAAVDANGKIKEIRKWSMPGALSEKDGTPKFSGINQQLAKQGFRQDFIDFINSVDENVRNKYISISKKGLVTVKKDARSIQDIFNEITLGNFEESVRQSVTASQDELANRKLLLSNQFSFADAVEASKDATLAEALTVARSITDQKEREATVKRILNLYKEQKAVLENTKTSEEKFNDLFDKISKKFDADRNKINITFELRTVDSKKVVAAAQNDLNILRYQLDDYNAGLTRLEPIEEAINKKYDDRIESLENIRDLNERISRQKESELDISASIARGDIVGAAIAIQKEQERQAKEAMDEKIKNLEKQREAELNKATTRVMVAGNAQMMTKEEINKRIKDLEMQIFNIEEDRLEPAQRQIEFQTELRDIALASLDAQKLKWDELKNNIDLAATAALSYVELLKEAARLSGLAVGDYTNPPPKDDTPPAVKKAPAKNELYAAAKVYAPGIYEQITNIASRVGKAKTEEEKNRIRAEATPLYDQLATLAAAGKLGTFDSAGKFIAPAGSTTKPAGPTNTGSTNPTNTGSTNPTNTGSTNPTNTGSTNPTAPAPTRQEIIDSENRRDAARSPNTIAPVGGQGTWTAKTVVAPTKPPGVSNSVFYDPNKNESLQLPNGAVVQSKETYANGVVRVTYAIPIKRSMGGMVMPSPEPPPKMMAAGGFVKPEYFNFGGIARGTDTVPAMLTPGEFIMSKYAVDTYGVNAMKAMNSGELSGGSVYNSYAVNVNVRSDANPDQIARAVMGQIRQVNSQQLRGRI
jgi:TP901 family phage tail tape measure protein